MTFCTPSRTRQWVMWLCAALVATALYVILSRLLYGSSGGDLLTPQQHRILLPILALFGLFVWETRWDGVKRQAESAVAEDGEPSPEARAPAVSQGERKDEPPVPVRQDVKDQEPPSPSLPPKDPAPLARATCQIDETRKHPASPVMPQPTAEELSAGEELYEKAIRLPHRTFPELSIDWEYLDLLGKSADKGCLKALMKLGEYAMHRETWVEAYYWMWQARKRGMKNASLVLREIRICWAGDGFPDEESNVNRLFSERSGSIGRALLDLESGRNMALARNFLKAEAPEFLN